MQTKSQKVMAVLVYHFWKTVKYRETAGTIRFNIDSIKGKQLAPLANLSMTGAAAIDIKRSGTGLVVIITL